MSLLPSLVSSKVWKCLKISNKTSSSNWKLIIKIPSRNYGSVDGKDPAMKFPSFSTKSGHQRGTNFEGFNAEPPLSVYTNTIWKGEPNYDNLPPKFLEKLNQPAYELLDGTSFAIEAITKAISSERLDTTDNKVNNNSEDNGVLDACLTPGCLYRLRNCYLSMNDLRNRHFLVNTTKEDIVFSWIHSLNVDEFGSTLMNVCTLSFPQHGFIKQTRNEAKENHSKLYKDIRNMKTEKEKEELSKRIDQLKNNPPEIMGYSIRQFIKVHDMVVSNFLFKLGPKSDDSWLVDEIMMRNAAEIYSTIKCLRWKGRMILSILGLSFRKVFMVDILYAGMFSAFIATIL